MAKEYFVKEGDIDVLKGNVDNKISSPNTAEVGQILSVKAIDENGKPTEWEVVNKPGSGPGESSPYIYMTQAEYEALTEYEQDKMYWVTYPFTGCYLVWKNGVAIMGEGCTELPVYSDSSATGNYFCANRNIVINFNPVAAGFMQDVASPSNKNKWIRWGNNLELVEMTDNVDSIGINCFKEHTDLKGIKLSNNISEIPGSLCSDCKKLERVIIGNSTLTIGNNAFSGCSSLTNITIPNSVTSIGSSAFYYCTRLKSITIPDSVTSIRDYALRGCTNLANIYYKGTEEQWNAITKGSEWNDSMGSNITGGTVIHYNS